MLSTFGKLCVQRLKVLFLKRFSGTVKSYDVVITTELVILWFRFGNINYNEEEETRFR